MLCQSIATQGKFPSISNIANLGFSQVIWGGVQPQPTTYMYPYLSGFPRSETSPLAMWVNPHCAWDNNREGPQATMSLFPSSFLEGPSDFTSAYLYADGGIVCSNSGIVKVEVAVYYSSGTVGVRPVIIPFFNGSIKGLTYLFPVAPFNGWAYVNITNDPYGPGRGSWTKEDVENLDVKLWVKFTKTGQFGLGVGQIAIRVTAY